MKELLKPLLCGAALCAAAPGFAQELAAPLAADWLSTSVFRDEVETTDAVPFVAPLPAGATFRARWTDGTDALHSLELRLEKDADGGPALAAAFARETAALGLQGGAAGTIPLAAPPPGPRVRTAVFPGPPGVQGRKPEPFVALAWTQPDAEKPFPVYGIFPVPKNRREGLARLRDFLRAPASVFENAEADDRPFVLWVGGADPPAAIRSPAPIARAEPRPAPGVLSFPGLAARADGGSGAMFATNAPISDTLRLRMQLRVRASAAGPATEQRLRIGADWVLDRRPGPRQPWVSVPGSAGRLVREGRWVARAGGGFDLRGDFRPRLAPGRERNEWQGGSHVDADGLEGRLRVALSIDAPAPEELADPSFPVSPATIEVQAFFSRLKPGGGGGDYYEREVAADGRIRVPLGVALAPAPAGGASAPPAAAPTPAEVRALAARIGRMDRSDARAVIAACTNALARVAPSFDPAWDPDLERDERRRALQDERRRRGERPVYVPWSEARAWGPADELQPAIARLRAACVDALFEATGREGAPEKLRAAGIDPNALWPQVLRDDGIVVSALRAPPALARTLASDLAVRRLRTLGAGDAMAMQAMQGAVKGNVAIPARPAEQAALALPVLRAIRDLPFDWSAFRPWDDDRDPEPGSVNSMLWDQPARFPMAGEILREIEPDDSCAVWFVAAEIIGKCIAAADRLKDVIVPVNVRRDAAGKIVAAERIPYFAVQFANALWAFHLHDVVPKSVVHEPDAIADPFFHELARLVYPDGTTPAYAEDPDRFFGNSTQRPRAPRERADREQFAGRLKYFLRADNLDEYFQMLDEEAEPEVAPAAAAPSAAPPRLEPYPVTPALRAELERYGLEAGVALRAERAPDDEPARQPYLLFAPTNAPAGARLPLVFFAPGSGELGHDLARQFRQRGIFETICSPAFQARHPCFLLVMPPEEGKQTVLYGSLPGGRPTHEQCFLLDALLAVARAQKGPQVDEDRIVGAGLVSGSTELLGLARNFPRFFAGLALTAPGLFDPKNDIPAAAPTRRWDFQTAGEWSLRRSPDFESYYERLGAAVRDRGGELRRTVFDPDGRPVWDRAWETDELWDWLLALRRPDPAPRSILRSSDGLFEVFRPQ